MTIIDNAVYVDGHRTADPEGLEETYFLLRQRQGMAWIGLYRPEEQEVQALASEFQLHPLAVEDAIHAHQRPKIERHEDTLFIVLRPARYVDATEEVEFGEVHVFVGPRFVLTLRHSEAPEFGSVRDRLESEPEVLRRGPEAVLYAILDKVVDGYYPVVAGVHHEVSRRIYELSREVADFLRATRPLTDVITALRAGFAKYQVEEALQDSLRDVEDHLIQIIERVDEFRVALRDMLTVNATLVAQRQNEEMRSIAEAANAQNEEVKKISAWAAIIFAPTLVGTIYGMNFDNIPELHWTYGYPFALILMVLVSVGLWLVFRYRGWL